MHKPSLSRHQLICLQISAIVVVFVWAWWPAFGDLLKTWTSDPDYNHGFLVLPVAVWLLWQRREELKLKTHTRSEFTQANMWGLALVVAAGALRWSGAEFFFREFESWSIPLWLGGVVLLFGGWPLFKQSWSSIVFLWFMMPLPATLTNFLTLPLQRASAVLSTWTLHLLAQPAVLRGTTISLDGHVLDVERACSGLRICYGTLAMAVACVILLRPRILRSTTLIAVSLPIAIVANSARVTLTGTMLQVLPGESAERIAHDFSGMLMLPLAMVLLWLVWKSIDRTTAAFRISSYRGSLLILKCTLALAGVGLVLGFWQRQQSAAAITTLLHAADRQTATARQHAQTGDAEASLKAYARAADMLGHFCQLKPQHALGAEKLARATEQLGITRPVRLRAAKLYQVAWKLAPDRPELGFKAAQLGIEAGLYQEAAATSAEVMDATISEASARLNAFRLQRQALRRLATSVAARQTAWDELAAALQMGIDQQLDTADCAHELAVLHREHSLANVPEESRQSTADALIDHMLSSDPHNPRAWWLRSLYRRDYPDAVLKDVQSEHLSETLLDDAGASGSSSSSVLSPDASSSPTSADRDLDIAIALAQLKQNRANSDLLSIWLAAGNRARRNQELASAQNYYRQATACAPDDYQAWLRLSQLATATESKSTGTSKVTANQRHTAISLLKKALARPALANEVLLRLELIRHQLYSDDSYERADAQQQIRNLKTQFQPLADRVRGSLLLNLAIVEAQADAEMGRVDRAIRILQTTLESDDVQTLPAEGGGLLSGTWLLLGSCYEQQGQALEAQQCFEKALFLEPQSVETLWFQATAAEKENQTGLAGQFYHDVAVRLRNHPQPWLAVARVELQRQRSLASVDRSGDALMLALQRARQAGARLSQTAILEADWRLMNGDTNPASQLLQQAAAEAPNEPAVWQRMAELHSQQQQPELLEQALKRLRELSGDTAKPLLLEARLMLSSGREGQARAVLKQALNGQYGVQEELEVTNLFANLETAAGNTQEAQKILQDFTLKHPENIDGHRRLAEFLWQTSQMQLLPAVEQQLQTAEGADGVLWQELRARRLIHVASQTSDQEELHKIIMEAHGILDRIRERPAVRTAALTLTGRLAALQGHHAQAAAVLKKAWQQQSDSDALAAELVFTYLAAGDSSQAYEQLAAVADRVWQSPQLFDLALELQAPILRQQLPRAQQVASDWSDAFADADSHLRVARVLLLDRSVSNANRNARLKMAESAYQKALQMNPADPQAWGEFLRVVYQQQNSTVQLFTQMNRLLADARVSSLDRTFIVARLLTEIGKTSLAARYWHQAIQIANTEGRPQVQHRVLLSAAQFFLSSDPLLSGTLCRRALKLQPENRKGSRMLLQTLTSQGTQTALKAAAPVMKSLLTDDQLITDDDRRAAAEMLYLRATRQTPQTNSHTRTDLQTALQLLHGLQRPIEQDAIRKAEIMYHQGDQQAGLYALSEIAGRSDASVSALQTFVQLWQDTTEQTDALKSRADATLRRLRQTPGAQATALTLHLRSPNLTDQQTLELTRDFLNRIQTPASTEQQRNAVLQSVFTTLLTLERPSVAMSLSTAPLPEYTADEQLAALIMAAMNTRIDSGFHADLKAQVLQKLDSTSSTAIRSIAADYLFMQAEWQPAQKLYRERLSNDPRDIGAANNLALLTGLKEQDFDAAHDLVNKAFEALEHLPEYTSIVKDTRGWLLMAEGNLNDAYQIFHQLSQSVEADASVFLHLAECARRLGRTADSRNALNTARQMGLQQTLMFPFEQQLYADLSRESLR